MILNANFSLFEFSQGKYNFSVSKCSSKQNMYNYRNFYSYYGIDQDARYDLLKFLFMSYELFICYW